MLALQPPDSKIPRRPLPIAGQKFNRWTLILFNGWIGTAQSWECACDCGAINKSVRLNDLRTGRTKSCGCLPIEINTTHGKTHTAEYNIWRGIQQRCYNAKNPAYENYGGRGIQVCERWRNSFENFLADMGPRPSQKHSIDRKNNDKDYSPENCWWKDSEWQNNNRRNTLYMTVNDEKIAIQLAARKYGVKYQTIVSRLKRGVSPENAIKKVE